MPSIRILHPRAQKAFTIVEVIVVVAVISVLSTVGMVTSQKMQQQARDSERSSKASIIASSLERYYETNREYPGCSALRSTPSTVKSTVLTNLASPDALRAPTATSGSNSIRCAADVPAGNVDAFTYTCTNNVACVEWKIKYRNEADGQVKTIASLNGPPPGPPTLPIPTVDLVATISSQTATGTATANCRAGSTTTYQIRAYKNPGTFGAWTNGNTTTVSPLNEGESATFQAQAQCSQAGFNTSDWAQSDDVTATRPVTAPTGLTLVASISGTNAVATVGGGTCTPGMTLQRQIRWKSTVTPGWGTWSAFENLAGTTYSVPASEGWEYEFDHRAQCVNTGTGVGSDWTTIPTAKVVRPIATLAAPTVNAAGSAPRIQFTWSGPGTCPNGTSKEYRWQLQRNGSDAYTSDWWGPSAGTVFDWNDISEGYTFTGYVQQRCISGVAAGAWSANGSDSYYRPIDAPGAPTGFTSDRAGTGGIAFNWNAPTCGWGTQGQWRADFVNGGGTGIQWINPPSGHVDYWWFGTRTTAESGANPSTAWTNALPSYGFMGDRNNQYSVNPPRMNLDAGTNGAFDADNYIGIAVEYRCVNTYTNVNGPVGPKNSGAYKW